MPRARLIRRRSTFTATRESGRRTSNRWMTLSVLPHLPDGEAAETAFLSPKRIGGAVQRNRLRRRMREIYRRQIAPHLSSSGKYHVWIGRPAVIELSFDELRDCMIALARRAGVMNQT